MGSCREPEQRGLTGLRPREEVTRREGKKEERPWNLRGWPMHASPLGCVDIGVWWSIFILANWNAWSMTTGRASWERARGTWSEQIAGRQYSDVGPIDSTAAILITELWQGANGAAVEHDWAFDRHVSNIRLLYGYCCCCTPRDLTSSRARPVWPSRNGFGRINEITRNSRSAKTLLML